jgi:hypothetical protein
MTSQENQSENLHDSISGIFGKKFMGTHFNAVASTVFRALHGSHMGDPFKIGNPWVYCKYLFSNKIPTQ